MLERVVQRPQTAYRQWATGAPPGHNCLSTAQDDAGEPATRVPALKGTGCLSRRRETLTNHAGSQHGRRANDVPHMRLGNANSYAGDRAILRRRVCVFAETMPHTAEEPVRLEALGHGSARWRAGAACRPPCSEHSSARGRTAA